MSVVYGGSRALSLARVAGLVGSVPMVVHIASVACPEVPFGDLLIGELARVDRGSADVVLSRWPFLRGAGINSTVVAEVEAFISDLADELANRALQACGSVAVPA